MPRRRKIAVRITALLLVVVGVALLAGCGGGGGDKAASSSSSPRQLLRETFSGHKDVHSGKLLVALDVTSPGASGGRIDARLSGPFESQGKGKLPKVALELSLNATGRDVKAGLISTGDKAFVTVKGNAYQVPGEAFQRFKKGYEQAQANAGSQKGQSLSSLGIDPQRWLTNPRNAGEKTVGDTETIEITGGVDVRKLLDDVDRLLQRTRSLGGSAAQQIPQQLTEQEKQEAARAVKNLAVQIYTGKDDKILRRMVVALDLQGPQGTSAAGQTANVRLDVQLTDVNEGQDISAPSNLKPFDQLPGALSDAFGLGSAGLGGTSGSTGGASADNLQKYSDCIRKAGNDAAKARKCANLLTP